MTLLPGQPHSPRSRHKRNSRRRTSWCATLHTRLVVGGEYIDAIADARNRLDGGEDLDAVLALLRSRGVSTILCMEFVRDRIGVGVGEAKRIILDSPAFTDGPSASGG